MKILLAGGGTGGPAMPLLAVAEKIKKQVPDTEFLFVGTSAGPEKQFSEQHDIAFRSIASGKFRRYFSWQNFIAPFLVLLGLFQACSIMMTFKPDIVFGAGGYVSVPVILAAKLFGKKIIIHQQDIQETLSNKLAAPFANIITVSFEKSLKDFSSGSGLSELKTKAIWTGNPVRQNIFDAAKENKDDLKRKLGLSTDLPVLLVIGGATGALGLNKIISRDLPELTNLAQIVHATGKNRAASNTKLEHYFAYELIPNIAEYLVVADIVIARAGLSTIAELAALGKVSIIVPMPNSHQLLNAEYLDKRSAAVVLSQEDLERKPELLISAIKKLMYNRDWQTELQENIKHAMPEDSAEKIATLIINLCKTKKS